MIRASAGSGKTWQLANRYLALLALGVKPERIIALTFTRKAAGEFADRILMRLAEGAESDLKAGELREEMKKAILGDDSVPPLVEGAVTLPEMDVEFFRGLLDKVVTAMDRLALSTLDSFFIKLLRNFAFELGMSGFELVDGAELDLERMKVFADIFQNSSRGGAGAGTAMNEFVQAFSQTNAGEESIRLNDRLEEFVQAHHHRWLKFPDSQCWGNAEKIWDSGCPWPSGGDYAAKVERVEKCIDGAEFSHKSYVKSLRSVCAMLREREGKAGSPLKAVGRFSKLMAALPELREGCFVDVAYKKEQVIDGELAAAFYALLGGLVTDEITAKLKRTQGVYAVVKAFESRYGSKVRGQGKLGFADATLMLSGHESVGLWDEVSKELVDFRFDGKFDHWMLDEFQDTSVNQWNVIQNLVDEVVNEEESERSLFVVGDAKQGIYGWRGGEPKLFDELTERYEGRLQQWPMDRSWRSSGEVLELVNQVCEPTSKGMQLFPVQAIGRWKFQQHTAAKPIAGHSWVCEMDAAEDLSSNEVKLRWLGELVTKIDPVRRGLSCGVLVRKNASGREIAEYLREHHPDIPVAVDDELLVAEENPVTAVIVDAFRFLCYPGDTLGWWHVQMSPFAQVFNAGRSGDDLHPAAVWYHWSRALAEQGIDVVLRGWIQSLTEKVDISDYSRGKLEELELAAAEFSQQGGSIADWLRVLENWSQREVTRAGVVQVMTVHKAKGLGFDAVILPDLENDAFDVESRLKILVSEENGGHVMIPPNKDIRAAEPALQAQVEQWSVDQCYEQFCVLYVMLTRAVHGTYCLLDAAKNKPEKRKRNEADWIRESLDGCQQREESMGELTGTLLAEFGSWQWLDSIEVMADADDISSTKELRLPAPELRKSRLVASVHDDVNFASRLMDSGGSKYGTLVHQCFESIEWWQGSLSWQGDPAIGTMVKECMEVSSIAPYFKQDKGLKVYREQAVEAIIDGVWVSGIIDRLIVSYDKSGKVEHAAVIDMKTDRIEEIDELTEKYAAQISRYQQMVAEIFSLPVALVYGVIISTYHRRGVLVGVK